jgi:hypothetical protein
MSKHEAQVRFHDWCAARHRNAETRRLWRSRWVMHARRSLLTNVPIRSGSCAEGGFILRHRPLTHRIVKEI